MFFALSFDIFKCITANLQSNDIILWEKGHWLTWHDHPPYNESFQNNFQVLLKRLKINVFCVKYARYLWRTISHVVCSVDASLLSRRKNACGHVLNGSWEPPWPCASGTALATTILAKAGRTRMWAQLGMWKWKSEILLPAAKGFPHTWTRVGPRPTLDKS